MADYYYGIDKGKGSFDAVGDTSTTSKVIELRVADTVLNKDEVLLALKNLELFILRKPFPSA